MKLRFTTSVSGHFEDVFKCFDRKLFEKLQPPLLPTSIDRYDGNTKGSEVHLSLGLGFFKQKWVSLISDYQLSHDQAFFVDEGIKLPPPLCFWRHQHIVLYKSKSESIIVDSIEFRTKNSLAQLLVTPAITTMFLLRKPIYKRFFKELDNGTLQV